MHQVNTADQHARTLLHAIYYYAKFLGVINCRLDKDQLKVYRVQYRGKYVVRTIRFMLIFSYISALASLFEPFDLRGESNNFITYLAILQAISVMIFAIFIAIIQTRCEAQLMQLLNKFMRLYQRVMERCRRRSIVGEHSGMFNRKFLIILLLKLTTTSIGYVNEIQGFLSVKDLLTEGPVHFIGAFAGIYLWMGSMLVLDVCVLALLCIALMYEKMGKFLRRMLSRMSAFEEAEENEESCATKAGKLRFSNHRRMKLLCDCADVMTDCDVIYAELYALTKNFLRLFQWQIFYYIYYNFMVILLLFHTCIWTYLHTDVMSKLGLLMVATKIANLAMLIMCADLVVERSQMPKLLCLDVICSDIDERWCSSVEAFLGRRQTESLEIKVLGFFQLNNEFILLILSAIVSYLFIIIQFGLTDMK